MDEILGPVRANVMKGSEPLAETLDSSQFTSTDLVGLNFKVPLQFRLQFKVYATKQNMTMTELLLQLFEDRLRIAACNRNTPTGLELTGDKGM